MNVVFRSDASDVIASGHIMRCLTLADALRKNGATVLFVCREHEGHLGRLIRQRGFDVVMLAVHTSFETDAARSYSTWLGGSWEEDAEETISAIRTKGIQPDWLVVDHYAIDDRWETALLTVAPRILVIDDLADRVHSCQVLLDQNLVAHMRDRYAGKVPPECHLLLGPENALLQPIYAELHERLSTPRGPVSRVFIFFGGSDRDNLTGRSLAALSSLRRPDIRVDAVISSSSPHVAGIRQQVAACPNVRLHDTMPTLATLMHEADLALGASGATNWERLCLGLPSIVVSLADNQHPVAAYLHELGLIDWVGPKEQATKERIAERLSRVLDAPSLEDWSTRCSRACGGQGVSRVLETMIAISGGDEGRR